jgi:hypothetical protein
MIEHEEAPSLLEIRSWKEQCRLEDNLLTREEYLKKLKTVVTQLKAEYHLNLPKVTLPSVKL